MGLLKNDDESESISSSADWLNEVHRGGLWHVQEGTYMLFVAMEEVREHLQVRDMKERCREQIVTAVKKNEEYCITGAC